MTNEVYLSEKVILELEKFHNGNALVKYYTSNYVCPNSISSKFINRTKERTRQTNSYRGSF